MGGFELIVGIVPVVVIVIFIMATSVRILREYETRGHLPVRATGERHLQPWGRRLGAGADTPDPLGGQAGEGEPADRYDGRAASGRDHA